MDRGAWWATVQRVAKEVDTTERLNNHHLVTKKVPKGLKSQGQDANE